MNIRSLIEKVIVKIRTKLRLFITQRFRINARLLPSGITKLSALHSSQLIYKELNPAYISTLQLPAKFIADCSPALKPEITRPFGPDYVAVLKNGRIYAHDDCNIAVISADNKLIEDASFQYSDDAWKLPSENKVVHLKGMTRPLKVKGKVASLLCNGGAKYYYYAWVLELLPKIHLLKQSGEFDKVDYFFIPFYRYKYQREYLSHFGIERNKIINEEFHPHVQADELVITSFIGKMAHFPKWSFDFLHQRMCPASGKNEKRLVYITRKDAPVNRPILNEDELVAKLSTYGFEIIYLTKLSVHEQARIFNQAKVVVGAHGGGFTNLIYCQPTTRILELFPSSYVRHGYYDIANKMGLEYHYMLCEPDRPPLIGTAGQIVGMTVDIEKFIDKLEELLA